MGNRLTPEQRLDALAQMAAAPLDVLVIGGGVTGAGTALDAAARGLRTGIVEMQDWAQGTSSRSSKLVHGGLRYLYQLDFPLVAEALAERGRLLTTIAPHLVKAQPFLWPLRTPVIERAYSAVGVGLYDILARRAGGRLPLQKHLSRRGARELFPDIRPDSLVGAIRFFDARVDDARLVIDLVRTAIDRGALAASRTEVVGFVVDAGRVVGATVMDTETGTEHVIRARHVIAAAGVWTEQLQSLVPGAGGLKVLMSKGIHVVIPKDRITGSTGLFLRTEKSVLFIIPWDHYWVIGTTDTPWSHQPEEPVATAADIDYILDHANRILTSDLTRADVIGTYAGLRPLLQPGTAGDTASTKVSREHTVAEAAPGLAVIAGGKLTTYRVMAADAVDFVLGDRARALPSVTADLPLLGAADYHATMARAGAIGNSLGWDPDMVRELIDRYGDQIDQLVAMAEADPTLAAPLTGAPHHLRVEVAHAVTHDGALHLSDVLRHRVRMDQELPDRGLGVAEEVADIITPLLGWTAAQREAELAGLERWIHAVQAAEQEHTDAAAAARMEELQ